MEPIHISTELIAIVVFIGIALLGLAVGYGSLQQKVKDNKEKIKDNEDKAEVGRVENRDDHIKIYSKLEEISTDVATIARNGERRK